MSSIQNVVSTDLLAKIYIWTTRKGSIATKCGSSTLIN